MIPLRDSVRLRTFPIITWILIAATTVVFLYEINLQPGDLLIMVNRYGMIPNKVRQALTADGTSPFFPLVSLVTSIFLHRGWFHLLTNIWVLQIFGSRVEDNLGPGKYLAFYAVSGVLANLIHLSFNPANPAPAIGASGAIAGVMGFYFLLHPRAQVTAVIPILIIPWFIDVPAVFFLGFWFLSQIFSGLYAMGFAGSAGMGGVAWWAHAGGFLCGLIFARLVSIFKPGPGLSEEQYPPPF